MHLLITRHASAAAKLATLLDSNGFETQLEPLLDIKFNLKPVLLDDVQALIVTSANGAAALAQSTDERSLTVLAVGGATTAKLENEGFNKILTADGDAKSLIELVAETLSPEAGILVHISGEHIAGDLAGELTEKGFSIRRDVLYRAETPSELSNAAIKSLADHKIDVVLLFSQRTATTFANLVTQAKLEHELAFATAICLSGAVAQPVREFNWQKIEIAEWPDQQALLQRLLSLRDE
jgi:uroporphyrinogen-III synthase